MTSPFSLPKTKLVGPSIPPRKSKFLVYKQYFPNQTSSNFVQPIEEFSSNFRRYGGISTNVGQEVFSGKMSMNTVLDKVHAVTLNGMPIPGQTLAEVTKRVNSAKRIASEMEMPFSLSPILEYMIRFLIHIRNDIQDFDKEFQKGLKSLYSDSAIVIVREAFYESMKNLANARGEEFDLSRGKLPSRQTLINMLQSMFYTGRLPIEAKLNQNKRYRIERQALDAAEIVAFNQEKLQLLIKRKNLQNKLKRTLINYLRIKMERYQNDIQKSIAFSEGKKKKAVSDVFGYSFGRGDGGADAMKNSMQVENQYNQAAIQPIVDIAVSTTVQVLTYAAQSKFSQAQFRELNSVVPGFIQERVNIRVRDILNKVRNTAPDARVQYAQQLDPVSNVNVVNDDFLDPEEDFNPTEEDFNPTDEEIRANQDMSTKAEDLERRVRGQLSPSMQARIEQFNGLTAANASRVRAEVFAADSDPSSSSIAQNVSQNVIPTIHRMMEELQNTTNAIRSVQAQIEQSATENIPPVPENPVVDIATQAAEIASPIPAPPPPPPPLFTADIQPGNSVSTNVGNERSGPWTRSRARAEVLNAQAGAGPSSRPFSAEDLLARRNMLSPPTVNRREPAKNRFKSSLEELIKARRHLIQQGDEDDRNEDDGEF